MTPATANDPATPAGPNGPLRPPVRLTAVPDPAHVRLVWPGHSAPLPWRHPT